MFVLVLTNLQVLMSSLSILKFFSYFFEGTRCETVFKETASECSSCQQLHTVNFNPTQAAPTTPKPTIIQPDTTQAAKSAWCYPNPCLNGGMCAARPDNSSFICFCSSLYKGTTCEYSKVTSAFNAGRGFSNYESMIRVVDEDQQEKL